MIAIRKYMINRKKSSAVLTGKVNRGGIKKYSISNALGRVATITGLGLNPRDKNERVISRKKAQACNSIGRNT